MANPLRLWARAYANEYREMKSWVDSGAPGRNVGQPMPAKAIVRDGLADYWRLWESLASWVNPGLDERHTVRGCVTDSMAVNAWPCRDALGPGQHVVVVTKATIMRMQRVAYLVLLTMQCTPDLRREKSLIGALMPDVELGSEDFTAFSELAMQAAFVYLFTHEFAHLHNGHDGCATCTDDPITWWSDKIDSNLTSRAVEFDADASALVWTAMFFGRYNADASVLSQLGAVRARMVSACLKDDSGRATIAALGAVIFNLSMSSKAHVGDSTHPNFRERVRLAKVAIRSVAARSGVSGDIALECSVFGAMMVFIDAQRDATDRILVGKSTDGRADPLFLALRDGLLAGSDGEDDVNEKKRHRSMARKMSTLSAGLNARRIKSTLPQVDWWSMERDGL